MREIKFRAWDGEKFYYFDNFAYILDYCDISGWNVSPNVPDYKGPWLCGDSANNSEQFDLQQFTGLRDKNGKEIWEGDIVEWTWLHSAMQGAIKWDGERACFYAGDREGRLLSSVEVIGNIYENKELLNG